MSNLITDLDISTAVVGLPLNMKGRDTDQTRKTRNFIRQLENEMGLTIHLIDERLSTKAARDILRSKGQNAKQQKHSVDKYAAVVILQEYLDSR